MNLEILLNKIFEILLFPPGVNFLLLAVGYLLSKRSYRKIAMSFYAVSVSSLYLLSLPIVSDVLNRRLQSVPALTQSQVKQYANSQRDDIAIVILAGGRIRLAAEYGEIDTVSAMTLQRIQYAAWLHRKTQLPILVSGGSVFGESTPESVLMNQTMLSAFNIAPTWIEVDSRNTAENARFSNEILKQNEIKEILLVTHANHMPRAKREFSRYNLVVTTAPTGFKSTESTWRDYFPSSKGLFESQQALHEEIGRLWYSVRY